MVRQITISDEIFVRLRDRAESFVDREPEDVIRRLLDQTTPATNHGKPNSETDKVAAAGLLEPGRSSLSRVPRERGATVRIGERRINAVSVRALYEEALKLLVENHASELKSVVPLRTSGERFLIARKPIHPTGNPFVVPVDYRGFYMEAHKDYKNAIAHLRILCRRLRLPLEYLG